MPAMKQRNMLIKWRNLVLIWMMEHLQVINKIILRNLVDNLFRGAFILLCMHVSAETPIVDFQVVRRWSVSFLIQSVVGKRPTVCVRYVNSLLLCACITQNIVQRTSVKYHSVYRLNRNWGSNNFSIGFNKRRCCGGVWLWCKGLLQLRVQHKWHLSHHPHPWLWLFHNNNNPSSLE